MTKSDRDYLASSFFDLLNYQATDILSPIDPLTYRTPEGETCLHYAALRGLPRAIRLLVGAGMDVNIRGEMGATPLHVANLAKQSECMQVLLELGADPYLTDDFGCMAMD